MPRSESTRRAPGFTLVELILVMALLVVITALAVPSLAGSLRQRALAQEATRFLAAVEYGRDEAVSQGVPMILWIEAETGRFGVEARTGFAGVESRQREFVLNPDVHFDLRNAPRKTGLIDVVEFAPDGAPGAASLAELGFRDRFDSAITVARTNDGWAYEIVPEAGR